MTSHIIAVGSNDVTYDVAGSCSSNISQALRQIYRSQNTAKFNLLIYCTFIAESTEYKLTMIFRITCFRRHLDNKRDVKNTVGLF